MKILILQDHLRSGGTERQSILLAREFARAGHEATLITFRPGGRLAPSLSGINHLSLQAFDTGLDWFAPGLLRAVDRGRPGIVLCMGKTANAYAGRIQRWAHRRKRELAVVATLRAGYSLPWYYSRSIRMARHIVTNSREAAELFGARHSLPPASVSVIHNSLVFPETTPVRDETLRARLGAGPATTVLLCVAMFRPEKNQRDLIPIVAGLPANLDWQLWLAGEGPARAACEKLASSLGVETRVKFLGFQSDPGPLYAAADIAVHASKEEALSNFIIESQAHGLPAVACKALGMEECFLPARTGWIIPHGDPESFRSAILSLASATPSERATRSAEARAFARARFDVPTQVAAYLDLFQKLATHNGT